MPQRDAHAVKFDEVDRRFENHSDVHDELWGAINDLRNRLPLWATLLIAFLASICGGSLTIFGNQVFGRF